MSIIPLFIILYLLFVFLNNNAHKLYLNKNEKDIQDQMEIKNKNLNKVLICTVLLIVTGVVLYIISELLGNTLETLCYLFNIPELIIGILLGLITSIPELITFFESQKYYKKGQDDMFGVIEATNNLLTSNTLNLFIIQAIGIIIVHI